MARSKILLTGANGTVGRLLYLHLGPWYDLQICPGSAELDLTNTELVQKVFAYSNFDVIIHCAARGANDVRSADRSILDTNLDMYYNVLSNIRYKKFINISSGCELGYDMVNGSEPTEDHLLQQLPVLPYGMSKNLIARNNLKLPHHYNLRLFGIITQTRLFQKIWDATVAGETVFYIDDDRYMDYITEAQLASIVQHYIDTELPRYQDINMVPVTKLRVSEVAQRYIEENGLELSVEVRSVADNCNYVGNGARLAELGII